MLSRARFTFAAIAVLLVVAAVVFASCSRTNTTTVPEATGSTSSGSSSTTTEVSAVVALFSQNCAGCHLHQPGTGLAADQAAAFIRDGSGPMPGFAGQLTAKEIAQLAAYVTTPPGETTSTTAASPVAALFADKCGGCHSSPPGAGLTADQVATIIRDGMGAMPGFAGQLSSEQIQELTGYLTSPPESTTSTTAAADTSALYAQKCAGCHSSPPGAGLTTDQVATIIRDGSGAMPGFGGQFTPEQIQGLAAYLAAPTASTTTTTAATTTSALYAQKCAGCHSSRPGAGLTAGQAAGIIRGGTGGMPGFGGQLTSAQISSLAAYVARPTASTTTTTAASTAAGLFSQKCAGCHQSRPGAGLTAGQVVTIIRDGVGPMPGFAGQFTPEQIEELGEYLTTTPPSTTTTTTPGPHPAWKPLSSEQFVADLTAMGFTVAGAGPEETRTYALDGVQILYADLIDYLPADVYYKDAQGYHYVQEEGAINPTTGEPALVTKPTTTTTTTTTGSTTTTTGSTTTTTEAGTTTTGTTTTTLGINAAALYAQYCSGCHANGVGAGLTAAQIADIIANGKGVMPAFSSRMTGAQITALATYVAGGAH